MERYPYGAVLKIQREFTVQDIHRKMDQMKACNMNFVVVWPAVYWWETSSDPDYPFHVGHEILTYASKIGMGVIMELAGQITSLEYAPDFLMKNEYFAVKANGVVDNDKIIFDYLNYNHPEVKHLVQKHFSAVATAYKDHESLYGYDILNETMFTSYDIYTLQLFREWLKGKYQSIERLNDIWDHSYDNWQQVEFTSWLWASVMPYVDWQQFRKENMGMIVSEWRHYIREIDSTRVTIADNINSMVATDRFYDRPHDDWIVAKNVDEYGISFYPKENLLGTETYRRWLTFAGIHSATENGRFWISELQSHHRSMFNPFSVVYPHELNWWNWEAISHGAKGLIYWKWDPFIKGIQTSGRGLVDSQGRFTSRAEVASSVAGILNEYSKEFCSYLPAPPRVAILFDSLNQDFIKAFTLTVPNEKSIYVDSIAGLYECLWELNIPAKFITKEDLLAGRALEFRTLFLSNQLTISDDLSSALEDYARRGGTIVADGKFGEIDSNGILRAGDMTDSGHSWLGFSRLDVDPLHLPFSVRGTANDDQVLLSGYFERQILRIDDENDNVKVRGHFEDGLPAVLSTQIGQGEIIYISTMLWYGYHSSKDPNTLQWLEMLADSYHLRQNAVSNRSLKLATLTGDNGTIVFIFNYGETRAKGTVSLTDISSERLQVVDLRRYQAVETAQRHSSICYEVDLMAHEVGIYKVSWG